MEEVGRRAGVAVENARLYHATRESLRLGDEFLSVASHELKTPLTSLQLQVPGLRRNLAKAPLTPEKLAAKVATIDHQVERLGKLAESLLDVSRASARPLHLETEDVDLAQLVREATAGFYADLVAAGCRLELSLEEGVVGRWDRMRLAQVMIVSADGNARQRAASLGGECIAKPVRIEQVLDVLDRLCG